MTHNFEYLVMLFELANAPSIFQVFINSVLQDMLNAFAFRFLADILIYFLYEVNIHVSAYQNHVHVKLAKCLSHRIGLFPTLYISYWINKDGPQKCWDGIRMTCLKGIPMILYNGAQKLKSCSETLHLFSSLSILILLSLSQCRPMPQKLVFVQPSLS